MKVYKLKVIKKIIETTLIKDKYTFNKDLKVWDYNNNVKNLQIIMKSYWYFDYEATGYFGNATKSSLIKFAENVLDTHNSDWVFDYKMRIKIWNLELK